MEDINAVLAENLRRMRENRRLSLDAVARLTGVSKSMLGQRARRGEPDRFDHVEDSGRAEGELHGALPARAGARGGA